MADVLISKPLEISLQMRNVNKHCLPGLQPLGVEFVSMYQLSLLRPAFVHRNMTETSHKCMLKHVSA